MNREDLRLLIALAHQSAEDLNGEACKASAEEGVDADRRALEAQRVVSLAREMLL